MSISRPLLALSATAVAATAAVAVPVMTSAQAPPATETITFQEDVPRVVIDDVAPRSKKGEVVSQGDRLITHGGLFDAARKRLGTISTTCTAEGAPKPIFRAPLLCLVTYDVTGGGQVIAAGHFSLDGKGTLPIVGGSGAYAGVRGTVTSAAAPAKGFDDADVLTLQR